jgi:DinB superfamily
MAAERVSELLDLMDEAFQGARWHSLLTNLESVAPTDWLWVAPGGRRSIRDVVAHVGACKFMYHNQAFGDGQFTWDDPPVAGGDALATISSAIEWLREGHKRLRRSIAALDDDELPRPRPHHSGTPRETRWIIQTMIEHDLYHGGEINHIRALHQQNDEL